MRVYTYPSYAAIPKMSMISCGQFLSCDRQFSEGVMPKTGSTGCTGVSLSERWSVVDVDGMGSS